MMITRVPRVRALIPLVILVLLLLATLTQAQPSTRYFVQEGWISGGGYQLTLQAWQVNGLASGGGYQLMSPSATSQHVGSGCCCTYLPDILLNFR